MFVSIPSIFSFIWLTPIATYGFNATIVMWEYESPDFMPAFDRINTLTCSALSGLCYVLIVADVIRRVNDNIIPILKNDLPLTYENSITIIEYSQLVQFIRRLFPIDSKNIFTKKFD